MTSMKKIAFWAPDQVVESLERLANREQKLLGLATANSASVLRRLIVEEHRKVFNYDVETKKKGEKK